MARAAAKQQVKVIDDDLLARALASAVTTGDIVNFRLLFGPFSPGRSSSTERFESDKYSYLQPDQDTASDPEFEKALDLVRSEAAWSHIKTELDARRPAQFPSDLLLPLGDNGVRRGKYANAAQTYELLRIRRKMQDAFAEQGEKALDGGDMATAVTAYLISVGLAYDYAAFPDPQPLTPNYHGAALKLHGVYPTRKGDCVGWLDYEAQTQVALEYMLVDDQAAAALRERPVDVRARFLLELVRQIDPEWEAFVERYGDAVEQTKELRDYLQRHGIDTAPADESLTDEVEEQQWDDPRSIPATLLGRTIEDGTWWQYLKELAYTHPAAPLFVARQVVGDHEIIIPPLRTGVSLAGNLGLSTVQLEDAKE